MLKQKTTDPKICGFFNLTKKIYYCKFKWFLISGLAKSNYRIIISTSTTFIQLELSIHIKAVLILNIKKPFIKMSSLNDTGLFDFNVIFSEQECKEKMSVLLEIKRNEFKRIE